MCGSRWQAKALQCRVKPEHKSRGRRYHICSSTAAKFEKEKTSMHDPSRPRPPANPRLN